ncbi:hypothetical protein [Lentzea flaviverrucosa]|uniref:Uncharacterized protein n=1 Tax=Lentzea flaviverrucosa TaxID=200379 RepID=A0A1H9JTV6_9PSEU|nr:hypothetical protein [Lentzea flaviverrucosa]RDI26621.1 hypothetical protein DFR72_107262 [Lentzea flaviverrucosa]SEQ89955.1 hypothetical protein SAMN05216195_103355 [Lentzea flaviverrucosa]
MRLTILAAALALGATACGSPSPAPQGEAAGANTLASATSDKQQPAVKAELTMQGKPGLGLLVATNQGGAAGLPAYRCCTWAVRPRRRGPPRARLSRIRLRYRP